MLAQEPELDDQQTQDTGQGNSAHDPPSESKSPSSAPCACPVPESDFDMIDFMHQSAAYDMQQVLNKPNISLQFHRMFSVNDQEVKREEWCWNPEQALSVAQLVNYLLTPQVGHFQLKTLL